MNNFSLKSILMFGKNGLISFRINEKFNNQIISLSSSEVDFKYNHQIIEALNNFKPKLIINAAAYTAVDLAEDEESLANQINGKALKLIGEWAKANDSFVIHFSTDYVFDGSKISGYTTSDIPNPINAYGRSKLLGEVLLTETLCNFAIFRISWIYDTRGKNFYTTMLNLMKTKSEISVVNDQLGMPTKATWVAEIIFNLISNDRLKTGIFHLSPPGLMSWYDFAIKIKTENNLSTNIISVSSDKYLTKAQRPKNSKLVSSFEF